MRTFTILCIALICILCVADRAQADRPCFTDFDAAVQVVARLEPVPNHRQFDALVIAHLEDLRKGFAARSVLLCSFIGGIALQAKAEEPPSFDDATILAYFDEMNTIDIWLARIAVHQAASDDVKGIGRMIVEDHEKIQAKARALARKLNIIPRPESTDRSFNKLAELVALVQAKTGSEFDLVYLEHEIGFSEAFLAMLKERMVPAANQKELKRFLSDLVPEFEHHVVHMQEAAKKLGLRNETSTPASPSHHHGNHNRGGGA